MELLNLVINKALELGAEYVEARFHTVIGDNLYLKNGITEPGITINSKGIGIRVIKGGALVFGSTNILKRENLENLIEVLIRQAEVSSKILKDRVE
ncbi:hypothetical protein HRbin06_00055 [archaeon HR06]|nr:hypothetical protein HRbin06_00055 [archaeon HR06]